MAANYVKVFHIEGGTSGYCGDRTPLVPWPRRVVHDGIFFFDDANPVATAMAMAAAADASQHAGPRRQVCVYRRVQGYGHPAVGKYRPASQSEAA